MESNELHECVYTPYRTYRENILEYYNTGDLHDGYGPAIDHVKERADGSLWADNGEYATRVNYCPLCGYKAKAQFVIPKD